VFDLDDLSAFAGPARQAIRNAASRLDLLHGDIEGTVGMAKEMAETVAKAVVDALGGTYGSNVDMPKLARQVLDLFETEPAGLQGRTSLGRLGGGLTSTVVGLAELRNTDGTGHGRASTSDLDPAHATLARDAAIAWCRWALATTARILRQREKLDRAVNELAGERVFYRNEFPETLDRIGLQQLNERYQHKFGLAVGRRWNVGGTFLADEDVIQPMAAGTVEYPAAFAAGVIEGLLLDGDGFIRTSTRNVDSLIAITGRLGAEWRERVFADLADRSQDASLSFAFDDASQSYAIDRLRELAQSDESPGVRDAAAHIANRIERLRSALSSPDESG
jgi:hypothetical protein